MPIYEYFCKSCSAEFEALVIGGKSDVHCPGCGGSEIIRKLSTFASHGTGKGGDSCSGCSSGSCSTCG